MGAQAVVSGPWLRGIGATVDRRHPLPPELRDPAWRGPVEVAHASAARMQDGRGPDA